MKQLNLGLIGLGYIGKTHLRHGANLTGAKIVAVSDVSKKALAKARRAGIKSTFLDYQQLLKKPDIDAVIISLPTYLHKSCALNAAEAGKDIFLEKPLAKNPVEGKEIIHAVKKNGKKLMVGYHFRFVPSFRELKEQIVNGTLGEIQTAIATFVGAGPMIMHRADGHSPRPVPSWWLDKELTGGGVLMDLGCHLINLLRWYFGEIVDIKSYLGYRFNFDFEDHAECIAKFASGQVAIFNVGWFSLGHQVRVELFGTADNASAEINSPNKIAHAIQLLMGKSSQFYLPHFWELERFIHYLKNDIPPTPSGMDALGDLEVISKAYANRIQLE
jgi:predicted dehydrogenase